ncbi:hypothetical protein [Blastopirellula marina]|uniref:Uncharacterized protein n=1 Tax=Blastopirellula marina TaxID=124 RepID=A0A2S8F362_9BACT|nr:hypothetical protein [Blastopirellula marina]PQO26583.1 hypothetical protein C5Y98_29825 [Blastopirellula marina]PTL40894.1 hypothetical protein C5Y97_29840 [Blastopirellula marina]
MNQFPYITDYVNEIFAREKQRWDFKLLRPIIVFSYFFQRTLSFPLKFIFHRIPFGFEAYLIDWWMTWGLKYMATYDAAELLMRHVQIEPLLYRHILGPHSIKPDDAERRLNGIDGDFSLESIDVALANRMTVGHDLLSYEVVDRFDRDSFLANIDKIRAAKPEDHSQFSKEVLEINKKHSWQLLGPTNIVLLIVTTITFFGDLHTTITALNSFGSDSLLLWCMKQIYAGDQRAQIDLDFFMQEVSNRGHYNSSAFFSNPSQYLYYHIVFDEVCYDMLMNRPPVAEAK